MRCCNVVFGVLFCALFSIVEAAPLIDPIANVTIPAGKSLILPVTASSPSGQPLAYTVTSSTNGVAVVMHTNNPFWQLTVAQTAATNAPGAYLTPFRGGFVMVTNVGAMTFMLFPEYAPHTVNVFQGLTTAGFYNSNTIFHRVVTNFVIQGGDPLTNGAGGLVFEYDDEFHPQAVFTGNGQLALANNGKDTDGSQFFVTVGPQRSLDFRYTLFGQLTRGFTVLTNINRTALVTNTSRPLADEIIQSAAYVTNTTDTVVTLTATNVVGVTSTIKVIADAGVGGRTTNTFNVTTVADTNSNANPFIYPNTMTNLVAAMNQPLTNLISSFESNGLQLFWYPQLADGLSQSAVSAFLGNLSTNVLRTLTYNVSNRSGLLRTVITPASNYVGRVNIFFDVSVNSQWDVYFGSGLPLPPYDEQFITVVFGDTPIAGQANATTVLAGAPFTNVLLATFTNGVPGSATTNFAALINWGDNTLTTARITTNGTGQKLVLGAHAYTFPGVYPVYITVQSSVGATATVLSQVTAIPTLPKLVLGAPPVLGPGGFGFSLQNIAGLNGVIQISTNLKGWTTLTNFTGTEATLNFRDAGATNSSRRFYRALVP